MASGVSFNTVGIHFHNIFDLIGTFYGKGQPECIHSHIPYLIRLVKQVLRNTVVYKIITIAAAVECRELLTLSVREIIYARSAARLVLRSIL